MHLKNPPENQVTFAKELGQTHLKPGGLGHFQTCECPFFTEPPDTQGALMCFKHVKGQTHLKSRGSCFSHWTAPLENQQALWSFN